MIHGKEQVYDEQISPLMQQIIDICKQNGIPLFATFEIGDGDGEPEFCSTFLPQDGYHKGLDHLAVLARCLSPTGTNVDDYMLWVMRKAREAGHSSIILHQLGVPVTPDPS